MKVREYTNIHNYIDSRENRLLEKKDFIQKIIEPHNLEELKNLKINELRELYKITHIINGDLKDMRGYCFKCLTPLKPDYIKYENYCLDC